jgi:D-psicose/D-tagatose/L-ribulose 3-epimerase
MKLGVSNLAWDPTATDQAFELLRNYGAEGVEVAPTRIAPWDDLGPSELKSYRDKLRRAQLSACSLQAILFNRPQAQLLGDGDRFENLCNHMHHVGKVATALDTRIVVFGAPSNRSRGVLSIENATDLALTRMRVLGDIAAEYDYQIAVESVPEYYKSDFLTRISEVESFVDACGHPNVALHFDIACVTLAGDDPVACVGDVAGKIVHFHAAEPDLGSFIHPKCDHGNVGRILQRGHYSHWIVIEIRQIDGNGLLSVQSALAAVKEFYFGPPV